MTVHDWRKCFSPSVAGLAYSNLVYDWVKAAVMFGVINTVATLDHLDPPQPPKCITMLYVFAETYVKTRKSLTCVLYHVNGSCGKNENYGLTEG